VRTRRTWLRAIAMPVRGEGDEVIAALAMSSSQARLPDLLAASDDVAAIADELSSRLLREAV